MDFVRSIGLLFDNSLVGTPETLGFKGDTSNWNFGLANSSTASDILPLPLTLTPNTGTTQGWDSGGRFVDVNGDDLDDLMQKYRKVDGSWDWWLRINKGVSGPWVTSSTWLPPVTFSVFENINNNFYPNNWDAGARIADINGDSMPDIIKYSNSQYESTSPDQRNNGTYVKAKKPDLLSKITASTGGKTTITYKHTAQMTTCCTVLLNPKLPFTLYAVDALTTDDTFGNVGTTTYAYEGGEYYYNTPFDRQFAGFSKITATDPVGVKTTTFYHQGNTTNSSQGELSDHISNS